MSARSKSARPSRGSRDLCCALAVLGAIGGAAVACSKEPSQLSLLHVTSTSSGGAGNAKTGPLSDAGGAPGDGRATSGGSGGALAAPDGASRCRSDAECAAPKPYCSTLTGGCVQCLTDLACGDLHCDPLLQACTGCANDADCSGTTGHCEPTEQRCVQCTSSSQCAAGEVCGAEAHACAPACSSSADCSGSGRPICAVAARVCVECTKPTDCSVLAPNCDLRTGKCVQCLVDADCGRGHCRSTAHQCAECLTTADCAPGLRCIGDDCQP